MMRARSSSRFDIDKDPARMEELRQILDATDPDLSAFRRRGGKLLMYFGWADPQLNPLMGVEYYEQVVEKMGPSTGDFARLYMVPGMFHCGGGVGTGVFDTATPLVRWVEASAAPDQIEASRVVAGKVVRTRPLCPYPQVAPLQGECASTKRVISPARSLRAEWPASELGARRSHAATSCAGGGNRRHAASSQRC